MSANAVQSSPDRWLQESLRVSDEILAHDFAERELRLLDWVRRQTYGAQRPAVFIERLDTFAAALEISRGNVSSILKRLKGCLVLEERPQGFYALRQPVGDWKVRRRLQMFSVGEQLQLIQEQPHVRDMLRVVFLDGVPESGTAAGRSRIGNGAETSINTGMRATVPESGTAHVTCKGPHESMFHGTMFHAEEALRCMAFDVGAISQKTGQEIHDLVVKVTGPLRPDHDRSVWRRIQENPRLLWNLAQEARQRHDLRNKAGWINAGYLSAIGVGRHATLRSPNG